MKSRLSVDTSYLPKRSCILMVTCETHFAHGETSNRHIIAILLMFTSSCLEFVQKLAVYSIDKLWDILDCRVPPWALCHAGTQDKCINDFLAQPLIAFRCAHKS
jgi:hypothetical protein